MGYLTRRGLDGDRHVGGNPADGPTGARHPEPRGASKNRLRRLLTICRGIQALADDLIGHAVGGMEHDVRTGASMYGDV